MDKKFAAPKGREGKRGRKGQRRQRASQRGLRANWMDLTASQKRLTASQGGSYTRTNGQKLCRFLRTLRPEKEEKAREVRKIWEDVSEIWKGMERKVMRGKEKRRKER